MLIEDIEAYLNGFTFTSNSVTFAVKRGSLPETPDAVISLIEAEGMKAVRAMGPSGAAPLLERPLLEVHVRSPRKDYEAGRDVAEQVYVKLDHVATTQGGRAYFLQALAPPFRDGQDKDARMLFVTPVLVHKPRG